MVLTRLSAIKKKKYILPTNKNIANHNANCNINASSNIVTVEKTNCRIVSDTQTQIVDATQGATEYDSD